MSDQTEAEAPATGLPTPKYKVGDTLYWPASKTEHVEHSCPDCGGSEVWHVKTLIMEFDVPCQRCRSYGKQPARTLTTMRYVPIVNSLVVKTIKAECNSAPDKWNKPSKITYGGGNNSGWTVDEDKALATEVEAMALAVVIAARENVALDVRADEVCKREIAEMDLRDALAAEQNDLRRRAEIKYESAIEKIAQVPDEYYNFGSKIGEYDVRRIARHLLNELGENVPSEWGDD